MTKAQQAAEWVALGAHRVMRVWEDSEASVTGLKERNIAVKVMTRNVLSKHVEMSRRADQLAETERPNLLTSVDS